MLSPDSSTSKPLNFRTLYAAKTSSEKADLDLLWREKIDQWLSSFESLHTRRNYHRSLLEWQKFLDEQFGIVYLWQVTSEHAKAWLYYMLQIGSVLGIKPRPYSASTVNCRVAAVSSLYAYMANETSEVGGSKIPLFVDTLGRRRENPFLSNGFHRPVVQPYSTIRPVHPAMMLDILSFLEKKRNKSLADQRNYALLLTLYRTGWRGSEVLSLRWGQIKAYGVDTYVCEFRQGHIRKSRRSLPARCYHAITAYLTADERYKNIREDEYIWRPLKMRGTQNFPNVDGRDLANNSHLTRSTATEVFRRHIVRYYLRQWRPQNYRNLSDLKHIAKERAKHYSLHSLRHAFAQELYTVTGDLSRVQRQIDHLKIETTRLYLDSLQSPVDDYSDLLALKYGI